MCHVALLYDTEDILLCIAGGKSDGVAVLCVWDSDDWLTEMLLQFYDIDIRFFYICVNVCLNDCNSYCEKILYFLKVLSFHSYVGVFQCENECMIFLQRFTVPDVSITAYVEFDEAYKTNPGLSIAVTRRYDAPSFLKYWAKLYHHYKSDQKCSYKIYIISKVSYIFF